MSRTAHPRHRSAALLRARILEGLQRTGTDPWAATEIVRALGCGPASVAQALRRLAAEGHVVIVSAPYEPLVVRRAP